MFDRNIYSHFIFIHLDDFKAAFKPSQLDFKAAVEPLY